MSTNTSNLPDVQELQRIANQLFKALPEEAPKEISLDPYKHPRAAALAQSVSGGGQLCHWASFRMAWLHRR